MIKSIEQFSLRAIYIANINKFLTTKDINEFPAIILAYNRTRRDARRIMFLYVIYLYFFMTPIIKIL